jgi:hypothetical protein
MIVRWIWSVPPAMEMPGTERKISAIVPSSGDPGPAISACTRAACRAMTLLASLPNEPSGPGGRPAARVAAARSAVHRADQASSTSRAISWRTSGSSARRCAIARPGTKSGRPARCGYHLCGSLAAVRSAIASRQARPVAPAGTGPGRDAARRRSCARIDSATVQPPPCSPIR